MSQYKRFLKRGVRFYFKFDYKGKTYTSIAQYLTKQDAKRAENKLFQSLEQQVISPKKVIKLSELISERLEYLKSARSKKYHKESHRYLLILLDYFGNVPVNQISRGNIQKLLIGQSEKMKAGNNDNYSVNALLRASKALFNHAIKFCDLNISNPCIGVNMFPIDKRIKYIPTDEEIDAVLKLCNPDQRLLVEFVRDTGCRISEALRLTVIDIFDGYVILYTHKSKYSNLTPRRAFCDTSKLPKTNERIFHNWRIEEKPKFLYKKTGYKWGWHSMRHRFASLLSKQNKPIFEIMILLGHSQIKTTQNYLQIIGC